MAKAWQVGLLAAAVAGCGGGGATNPAYLVYIRDAQGSVVAAVDDDGQRVWETYDDAYGLRLSSTGTEVPREFLDQPFDEETGFYQFRYRMYDPQSAQWLSPDPRLTSDPGACAEQPQQCNPYAYAGGRPGEWIDRDGRWADPAYKIGSNTYQAISMAFVGKGCDEGAADLIAAFERSNSLPGNRRILYDVRAFEDPSQAPASYTKVMWAKDPAADDGRSYYDAATSTLMLRNDARAPKNRDDGLDVIIHESEHAFGAGDHYNPTSMASEPGFERDAMGNFHLWSGVPEIGHQDLVEEEAAKAAGTLNQSLTLPTPAEWPFPGAPPTQ
jgi:RHS repeat-associated protein